ncbi:MAG: hypothetical protein H6610_09520 [Ignavibacteriales bacterium]|nr:hypothetical protein [Ignavibacteriales bacterium]MCB9219682.1 hypothetical protein [Ignavibacteriales bacterium]
MKLKNTLSIKLVLLLIFVNGCQKFNNENQLVSIKNEISPKTENVDLKNYITVLYVSSNIEIGNGTKKNPYNSIHKAIDEAIEKTAILVAKSDTIKNTIVLKENVHLFGGFNPETWERDLERYSTIITSENEQRLIVAKDSSQVDGFIIINGKNRGNGTAIFCNGTSPIISNNIFENNITLKPSIWAPKFWHETANDGGAVYGCNGASPEIRGNLFVNNKTENGRGAAIAFNGNCNPLIINNVFLNNIAGLDDTMRSSDGGAVSLFNWCKGTIKRNIFLGNKARSNNDAGALFVALWSSPKIEDNYFIDNEAGDDAGALFVGGQEHRYDSPLDQYPPKDKFFVSIKNNIFIGNKNPSKNSGAMRFTMESRGEFIENIVAQNNGIYFQRSETNISNNIILDNMLVIETKKGLGKTTIKDNIIWADFTHSQTEADFINNRIYNFSENKMNQSIAPSFIDDGIELQVLSSYYLKKQNYSELIINNNQKNQLGGLTNRIVRSINKWSLIKSFRNNVIQIWGDFSNVTNIQILPTYTLNEK